MRVRFQVYSNTSHTVGYHIILLFNIYIDQLETNIEIKGVRFVRVGFDSAFVFHAISDPTLPAMGEPPVQFALLYAAFHMYSLKFYEHVK